MTDKALPFLSTGLRVLDLSHNLISGNLQATFAALPPSLRILDLSSNEITGKLHISDVPNHLEILRLKNNKGLRIKACMKIRGFQLILLY